MNIGDIIGISLSLSAVYLLVYYMVMTGANDLATKFIEESRKEIDALLAKHNLQLFDGIRTRDIAPCDMKYAINYKEGYVEPGLIHYLSSRKIKRLIVKLKRKEIEPYEIINYGFKHGKSNVKITQWSKV